MKSQELSPEDLSRLLQNLSLRDQALFSLMACTGARISEALSAKWQDWNPKGNPPTLRMIVNKQRARRLHTYPLHSIAHLALLAWFNSDSCNPSLPYIFASRCNRPVAIQTRQANRALARAADAAGLSFRPSTHSLRKYFARLLYNTTHQDIMTVAEALNHVSVKSTMHYLQAGRDQVDRLCLALSHDFAIPSFRSIPVLPSEYPGDESPYSACANCAEDKESSCG